MFVASDFDRQFKSLEQSLINIETELGREGPKDLDALGKRINSIGWNIFQLQSEYILNPLLAHFEGRFTDVGARAIAVSDKIESLKT